MKRAGDDLARLANDPPKTVTELTLLEARSAVAYFRAWHTTSLLWRASSRHPIPDEWRTVGPRYSRFYSAGSRHAAHPVNALLNYAYAALQSRVQVELITNGYDPTMGIMHSDRDDAPALALDMMEPDRPKVDRAVLVLNALLGLGTALAPIFIAIFVGLGIWWGLPLLVGGLLVAPGQGGEHRPRTIATSIIHENEFDRPPGAGGEHGVELTVKRGQAFCLIMHRSDNADQE